MDDHHTHPPRKHAERRRPYPYPPTVFDGHLPYPTQEKNRSSAAASLMVAIKPTGEDGIRTRAPEETGALIQRLRPTRPPHHAVVRKAAFCDLKRGASELFVCTRRVSSELLPSALTACILITTPIVVMRRRNLISFDLVYDRNPAAAEAHSRVGRYASYSAFRAVCAPPRACAACVRGRRRELGARSAHPPSRAGHAACGAPRSTWRCGWRCGSPLPPTTSSRPRSRA